MKIRSPLTSQSILKLKLLSNLVILEKNTKGLSFRKMQMTQSNIIFLRHLKKHASFHMMKISINLSIIDVEELTRALMLLAMSVLYTSES